MGRRREMLENFAFAKSRRAQQGVQCRDGFYTRNGLVMPAGDLSLEFCFYFDPEQEAAEHFPAVFGNVDNSMGGFVFMNDHYPGVASNLFRVARYVNWREQMSHYFSVPAAGWHHVVFTLEGLTGRVYLDGAPAVDPKNGRTECTFAQYPFARNGTVSVGAWHPAFGDERHYKGTIARVRIYDFALAEADAAELWNGGDSLGQLLPEGLKSGGTRVGGTGCKAEYLAQNATPSAWFDSAGLLSRDPGRRLPLRGSAGGADMAASGAPEVVGKP